METIVALLSLALLTVLTSASNENAASWSDGIAELDQVDAAAQQDSEQHAQQNSEQQEWGKTRSLAILKENWMSVLVGVVVWAVFYSFASRGRRLEVRLPAQVHTSLQNGTTSFTLPCLPAAQDKPT